MKRLSCAFVSELVSTIHVHHIYVSRYGCQPTSNLATIILLGNLKLDPGYY